MSRIIPQNISIDEIKNHTLQKCAVSVDNYINVLSELRENKENGEEISLVLFMI